MEFIEILFPVFFIFVIGYIGQKRIGFEVRSLSVMALYLMSPLLAFRTFYTTELDSTYLYMTLYCLGLCTVIITIIQIAARIKGYNESQKCGLILASAFMNNGNFGTPVALFAFGAVGLDYAVVLMVIQSLIMSTIGIYFAAKGGEGNNGFRQAMTSVIRMPIIYGALGGLLWKVLSVPMSKPLFQGIDFVANAAIPTIMLVLGIQLATITLKSIQISKVSFALFLRLLISPLIAICFVLVLPVDSLLAKIMILMAAMPTAANTTMYSLQFQTEPNLVSSSTLLSTLLSLVTLPVLLSFLL